MSNNLIRNIPQFNFACYSLLHAFLDPPKIIKNSFANPQIKYYYACISIVFMYSSVELFVKISSKTILEHLYGKTNDISIPPEHDDDFIFTFHKWSAKRNKYVKQAFSRVLEEIPKQARKRITSLKSVSDIDIEEYALYRKQFIFLKKMRDHLIHGSFETALNDKEFEDVYVWKRQGSKIVLDYSKLPEKALDFYILCINLLKFFTIVCFSAIEGNSKKNVTQAFDLRELLFHTVPFEYDIPQQLIDLLGKKLANYP